MKFHNIVLVLCFSLCSCGDTEETDRARQTAAAKQPDSGKRPAGVAQVAGVYSSVSESECNVELSLFDNRKAQIRQTCRGEGGSHSDDTKTFLASWHLANGMVVIVDGINSDTLVFGDVSFKEIGKPGSKPGLQLLHYTNGRRHETAL